MNSGRAVVHVCYHQLWIREDEPEPDFPAASYRYGLLDLADIGAVITTGIHTGAITVSVEVLDTPPSAVLDGWEEVVEASITASDELYLCPLTIIEGPPDLPVLNPDGLGDYESESTPTTEVTTGTAPTSSRSRSTSSWPGRLPRPPRSSTGSSTRRQKREAQVRQQLTH